MKLTRDQILALRDLLNSRGFVVFLPLLSEYRDTYENDEVPTSLADFLGRERDLGARAALKGLVKFITDTLDTEERKLKDTENEHGD